MFNNTFNRNRKDPLVDSIKAIMEDTNMRNQAEGLVCEAFGVFNANALANEDIEIFKDACEFVYSQLKEGVQLDELLGRGKLDAAVKSHLEKKGYTHTKSKDPQGGTRHSFEKAAKTPFKGEKKGFSYTRYKEKGEKHGDVNFGYYSKSAKSKKPNYGESGNDPESNLPSLVKSMKEGVQIDELYGKGRLKDIKHARSKETYKAMKKAEKASDVEHDEYGYRTGPSREDKAYGAAKHREEKADMVAQKLKHHRKKMGFKEETQIDEISKELAARYEKKATKRAFGGKDDYMNYEGASKKKQARAMDKFDNRLAGIQRARKIQGKRKLGIEIVNEDVFEELYISINEQALYAIETNQLESFVNNLSEEEFDFLDEEIVNEIAMGFAGAAGASANKSMNKTSVAPRKSSSLAGGSVSMAPSANAKPPASAHKSAASSGTGKSGYFSGSPNVSKGDYTVKSGENLSGIAKRLGTSVGAIQSMNKGMSDPNKIASGAKLNLPTIKTGNQMGPPASAAPSSSTGNRISPAPKTDSTDTSPGPNVQRDKTPSGNPGGETGIKSGNTVSLDRQVKDYADSNKPSDSAMAKTASNNNAPKDQAGAGNVDSQVSKRNFLDKQLKGDAAGAGGMQVTESVERKGFVTVGNMRIKLL